MSGDARKLKVLVVDDHDVVHWGFRVMLSELPWVEKTLSARNGEEAIALAKRYEPDVALVDLFVGEESGPEICEQLHLARRGVKVLLISGAGRISAEAARACGATGFVPKDWPAVDIARAVRMVGLGMSMFEPEDDAAANGAPRGPGLTPREQEVLQLVATGATNREIAAALHLSPHTVKEHASALYKKLEARNRADAVLRAQRMGILG